MPNCNNVLENGTCSTVDCPFEHNITVCEPCGRVFGDAHHFRQHLSGKWHRLGSVNGGALSCPLCKVNVTSGLNGWQVHLKTKSHQSKAKARGVTEVDPEPGKTKGGVKYCEFCQSIVLQNQWEGHINNLRHRSKVNYARYRAAIEDSEKEKNGVTINGEFDFGFVDPEDARGKKISGTITSTTAHPISHIQLSDIRLASSQGLRLSPSSFSVVLKGAERKIGTHKPLNFDVTVTESHIGRHEDRVEFLFEDTQLRQRFIITRVLLLIVGNFDEHQALAPKTPYVPPERSARKPLQKVVEGVRPPSTNALPYVGKLPKANIPSILSSILSSSKVAMKVAPIIKERFIPSDLDTNTYARNFKTLLWAEEFQAELDLGRYDIHETTLERHNGYFHLKVAGLAEKRPSVLVGDRIFVQESRETKKWFEGYVHFVRQQVVGLRFHADFNRVSSSSATYRVRFQFNRVSLRRQHLALDAAFVEDRVLFPRVDQLRSTITTPKTHPIQVVNPLVSSNPRQLQAVVSIINLQPGTLPFIVFGPPGTGKTVTMVEAIKQILAKDRNARILACAPSNSAVDVMASRLVKTKSSPGLSTEELFRLYAPSRSKNQVPDDLKSFIHCTSDGHLSVPPMARMKKFRIILSTCVSAAIVQGIGMSRGHFSHIFIDEAGQATEPETLESVMLLASPKTNVVLSGDPKQLGPVIRSGVARQLGLEVSYLQRVMDREAYDLKEGYGKSVVKLTKNFRSHPNILKYPNERFYGNDLQAFADQATINYYLKSQHLASPKFPIVFHSVSGKDEREASSPSFFNPYEVLQVKDYVQKLKDDRRYRTTDADIGIIAPYHAQCLKLRTALKSVAKEVKVGSVEEFQGQERKVIIISTVRSSKEFVSYDLRHTLGFVANPRRFNVAVTRAKSLLIVVGDPLVLSIDPLWRSFLNYIYLSGGWKGPDIPWDPKVKVDENGGYDKAIKQGNEVDMNAFMARLTDVTLAEVEDEADVNIDRPWRELE